MLDWPTPGLQVQGQPVLVIHHDDLGATHAQNQAHRALSAYPTGLVMLPTGWAAEPAGAGLPLTPGASLRDAQTAAHG